MSMGILPILASSPTRASGAVRLQMGPLQMALVPTSCHQRTMVWAHHILWLTSFEVFPPFQRADISRYCLLRYICTNSVLWETSWENNRYQLTPKWWTKYCPWSGLIKRYKFNCYLFAPQNHKNISTSDSLDKSQKSAQSFRSCVSGEFDMTPLVGNQGIIVNACHFYSSRCLSKLFRDSDIISPTYTKRSQTINTQGPQHVEGEDCGVGVRVSTSTWTLSS